MNASTLPRFLLGDRDAALAIAADPRRTVPVGLLFVASAALFREYDGVYLPVEPEHLGLPFAASLGLAVVTWLALTAARARRGGPAPAAGFPGYLAQFLWTAPLAWAYAVPWERLTDAAGAAVANLWTLAVVAAWRVALMSRAAAALLGAPTRSVATLLLGVAAPVVLVGVVQNAAVLVATMGGVRLEAGQAAAARLSMTLAPIALLVCPALLLAALVVAATRAAPWAPPPPPAPTPGRGAWAVAGAALLAGVGLLAVGQPEQARALAVERAAEAGRLDEVLRLQVTCAASDFPPRWSPPPRRVATGEDRAALLSVVEAALGDPATPAWVRARYADRLGAAVDHVRWRGREDEGERFWPRAARALLRLSDPEARAVGAAHPGVLAWLDEAGAGTAGVTTEGLAALRRAFGAGGP